MAFYDRLFSRPPKQDKSLGRSGTINSSGFLSDFEQESNALLRWPLSLQTYEKMRRTDPTIRWMLGLVKTPIRATSWMVEPATKDDGAREVAAFVEACLFEQLSGGFDDFLRRALTYLDFGHSVFERVAEYTPLRYTYETDAGDEVEVNREAFVIRYLGERLQRTILRWNPDPQVRSQLASIEQWLSDSLQPSQVTIPADRLVIFTNEQEGDDWRGVSLLRSAYKDWYAKDHLENLESIAYERSVGLWAVYPPDGATDPQLDSVVEGLKSLRQGEDAYFVAPGPKQGSNVAEGEGWLIEAVGLSGDADRSPTEAVQRHEGAMARNILAEFMRLGHAATGARATAEVQQAPYYQAVEAYVGYIEDAVTEQIIEPLVRWNYGESEAIPRLRAGKITAKNVQVLATAASSLLQTGGIVADLDTENALRELLDLPERKASTQESGQPVAPETPPKGPAADGGAANGNPPQTYAEFRPSRELRPEERYVAFGDIARQLDNAQADYVDQVLEAAEPGIAEAERVEAMAVGARSVDAVAQIEVPEEAIAAAIEGELASIYSEGQRQVRAELRRQDKGARFDAVPLSRTASFLMMATTSARGIAQAITRAIRMRAIRTIEHPQSPPTGPGYDPRQAASAEARGAALGQVNTAFANGRQAEIVAQRDRIAYTVYSALLDGHTCAACEGADGEQSPVGSPFTFCPNPDCEGGGACRCELIPVTHEAAAELSGGGTQVTIGTGNGIGVGPNRVG